jgi:hypothetical protein
MGYRNGGGVPQTKNFIRKVCQKSLHQCGHMFSNITLTIAYVKKKIKIMLKNVPPKDYYSLSIDELIFKLIKTLKEHPPVNIENYD